MNITTLKLGIDSTEAKKAKQELTGLQTSAQKAETATGKLGKTLAAIAASAVLVQIGRGLGVAIDKASALQESMSKFETVFASQIGMAGKWSDKLNEAYGQSRREATENLGAIQDLLVPMGLAEEAAGKLSFEVVKLATDLGSFNNQSTPKVIEDYQSALVGNYETMKKYGVVLNATVVSQKAMQMGLAKTKNELTASDKAMAAHELIVQSSTVAIGDFIRTSDGYANTTKKLDSAWEDFAATLGEEVLPAATGVKNILIETLDYWEKVFKTDSASKQISNLRIEIDAIQARIDKKISSRSSFLTNLGLGYEGSQGWKIEVERLQDAQGKLDALLEAQTINKQKELDKQDEAVKNSLANQLKAKTEAEIKAQSELNNISGFDNDTDEFEREIDEYYRLAKVLDEMRTSSDPLYAATKKLNGELSNLSELLKEGLIDESEFKRMAAGFRSVADEAGFIGSNLEANSTAMMDGLQISQRMFDQQSKEFKAIEIAIQAANVARAVGAILNQAAGGDPYTAFARMATMAAAVASLGVSVGGFSSGSGGSASAQETQGTGSVFGDSTAKSESILNATEITASATEKLVGINTGMLKALTGVQTGIRDATLKIASGLTLPAAGSYSTPSALKDNTISSALAYYSGGVSSVPLIADLMKNIGIEKISQKLFGGYSKVSNQGIEILSGYLFDTSNDVLAQAFTILKTKEYKWSSTKWTKYTQAITGQIGDEISGIFANIGTSVIEGAMALGINQQEIDDAISGYFSKTITISLKGLSGEDQQEALEAVFSKVFDNLAESVVPFLSDMALFGEGAAETLSRVASNVMVFEEAVSRLGFQAERVSTQQFAEMAVSMVEASGTMEDFIVSMDDFFRKFSSEADQFIIDQAGLERALSFVNLALPGTRDGMLELMRSLDATTEEGQNQITTLLNLAGASDEYYDQVEKAQERHNDTMQAAQDAYYDAIEDRITTLKSSYDSVSNVLDSKSGRKNLLESILGVRGIASELSSGNVDSLSNLDEFLSGISSADTGMYSTSEAYYLDQAKATSALTHLETIIGDQLTQEESLLNATWTQHEETITALNTINESITTNISSSGATQIEAEKKDGIVVELKVLREALKQQAVENQKLVKRLADTVDSWDNVGLPGERS